MGQLGASGIWLSPGRLDGGAGDSAPPPSPGDFQQIPLPELLAGASRLVVLGRELLPAGHA